MPLKITITKHIPLTLSQPVAANSPSMPLDVISIKKSLNRLGYYIPPKDIGITDIPDVGLFAAIKAFQKSMGLPVTGIVSPDDQSLTTLNAELQKPKKGFYVWDTVGDERVRPEHAAMDGMIRSWDDPVTPDTEAGCRCWATPAPDDILKIYDPPIHPVYPEVLLIPLLRTGKLAASSFRLIGTLLNKPPKLNSMQAENLNRFIKKIPANSKDSVKIKSLRDGNILFHATSHGKVEGTRAIYEKTVNANGKTIQYLKTTIGKDNKIIHTKNKIKDGINGE